MMKGVATFMWRATVVLLAVATTTICSALDRGASWKVTVTGCGDCGAWFADPAQPCNSPSSVSVIYGSYGDQVNCD